MRQLIADGVRVQTCVTSPPYYGLRDYGYAGQLGLEPTPAEYVAGMVEVFGLVRELLADDGTLWLNLGDSFRAKQLCGVPWLVAFALQADGWYLRSDIIWHKPNPMPESVTDRPTKAHEYLFLLAKSESYYCDMAAIAEPSLRAGDVPGGGRAATNALEHRAAFYRPENAIKEVADTRNKRSVWTVASAPYSQAHFATFPPALIEPCILAGSRVGDVVFDPFLGSGTTAQVAQNLGRQWLGCELNPDYLRLQAKRTAQTAMAL